MCYFSKLALGKRQAQHWNT